MNLRRPLAVICLIYIIVAGVCIWLRPPDINCYKHAEGMKCRVAGKLYKIESQNSFGKEQSIFYLNQISYFEVIQEKQFNPNSLTTKNDMPKGVVCYIAGDVAKPALGSLVLLTGKFEAYPIATNPGEFDARVYYSTQGISGKIQNAVVEYVSAEYNLLADTGHKMRLFLEEKIKSIYPSKEAGILMTMLLGNKAELDSTIKSLYQGAGIMHILSVSGLHVSVLGYGFYRLLCKLGVPVRVAVILSIIWMWFYGEMIGMGVSAFRAIVMFILRMLALWWGRTYDLLTALAVAAALLVGSEPMYFYHSGFWLSFSCVLAISLLYPRLKLEEKEGISPTHALGLKVYNSFLISVSVTIVTLPVMLWFYYEVSLWGLVLNLIVVPLTSVVMGGGIITLCLPIGREGISGSFFVNCSEAVSLVIAKGNCVVLGMFEGLCRIGEWSGLGTIILGKPELGQIIFFVAGLIVFMLFAKKLKYYQRFGALAVLVFVLGIRIPRDFTVTFLDVGQGDGICIQNDNGNIYLVDGGSSTKSNVGTYQILPFLKYEGIDKVNAVFLSHGDKDHISGIEELLQKQKNGVRIEKVILPLLATDVLQQEFGEIIKLCNENDTKIYVMGKGESWVDGRLMLTSMHPSKDFAGDSNESSLVLHMTYKNFSALLTGDVEEKGEQILTDTLVEQGIEDMTLLKVAHHGSSGSSSKKFLAQVSPQVAVISCGENNSYGHPHEETLARLSDCGTVILATPECGAITVEVRKQEVKVKSQQIPTR